MNNEMEQRIIRRIVANGESQHEAEARAAVLGALMSNQAEDEAETAAQMGAFEKRTLPAYGPVSIGSYRKHKRRK